MVYALIVMTILIVGAVWYFKRLTKPNRPCSQCSTTAAPLKWYALFNCWLCHPCTEKVIEQQLSTLYVEIRNRM